MKNMYLEIKELNNKRSILKAIKNDIIPIGKIVIHDNNVNVYVSEKLLNKYLKIIGNQNNCTFKNCDFITKVSISDVHNLTLIENEYSSPEEIQYYYDDTSLITGDVDNFIIAHNSSLLDLDIKAKKEIDIIYSNVYPYDYGKVKLKGNNINIIHSIVSDKLILDANRVYLINSNTLCNDNNLKRTKRN